MNPTLMGWEHQQDAIKYFSYYVINFIKSNEINKDFPDPTSLEIFIAKKRPSDNELEIIWDDVCQMNLKKIS
jgi:hypothetical protein